MRRSAALSYLIVYEPRQGQGRGQMAPTMNAVRRSEKERKCGLPPCFTPPPTNYMRANICSTFKAGKIGRDLVPKFSKSSDYLVG